jgi:hypothetical protein
MSARLVVPFGHLSGVPAQTADPHAAVPLRSAEETAQTGISNGNVRHVVLACAVIGMEADTFSLKQLRAAVFFLSALSVEMTLR